MPHPKLRPAIPSDLPHIIALVEAAYAPWIDVIGAKPGPMLDDYGRAIEKGIVQVLEDTMGIEAILVLIPLPDAMLLDNMAVHPNAQGKGHGKRLMRAAEDAAAASGYSRLRLYTHEKMASNIARYHRAGFDITKHVTERGLNRVYMEKRITPLAP